MFSKHPITYELCWYTGTMCICTRNTLQTLGVSWVRVHDQNSQISASINDQLIPCDMDSILYVNVYSRCMERWVMYTWVPSVYVQCVSFNMKTAGRIIYNWTKPIVDSFQITWFVSQRPMRRRSRKWQGILGSLRFTTRTRGFRSAMTVGTGRSPVSSAPN